MRRLLGHLFSPTGLLFIFVAIGQFAHAVYILAGDREPTPAFNFIYTAGFVWIITWWLLKDSRKRGIKSVYDMGLFLYIAWPFFMPYYLIKTRGAKGLLVILGFISVCLGAWLCGIALILLLFPEATWLE